MPHWLARRRSSAPLSVWSAACSTGEEPYTIAMVLANHAGLSRLSLTGFSILGTDVSPACVKSAERAVYNEVQVGAIPGPLRRRFLMRSKDPTVPRFRIVPALRARARFRTLNFVDKVWPVDDADIIFCRNVLIYFQPRTQYELLSRLCKHLRPGGCLFIGHAETLAGMNLPVVPIGRSVFQKV